MTKDNIRKIMKNIIGEIIITELIRLTFIKDKEALAVLSSDDKFFSHVKFIKERLFACRVVPIVVPEIVGDAFDQRFGPALGADIGRVVVYERLCGGR